MDENKTGRVTKATAAGSVFAGGLAAACCLGPPLFVFLGISGFGALSYLTKFHTPFLVLSVFMLGTAFYMAYRKPKKCADGCALPSQNKWNRITVWIAAGLVLLLIGFPYLT